MKNPGLKIEWTHVFVAEVYRRMSLRHCAERRAPSWTEVKDDPQVLLAEDELRGFLPSVPPWFRPFRPQPSPGKQDYPFRETA